MIELINRVSSFLANRDIPELNKVSLQEAYHLEYVDAVMLFGNELPYTAHFAAQVLNEGIAKRMIICGGAGHSTERLRRIIASSERYKESNEDLAGLSEAEIFALIMTKYCGVSIDKVFLDTESGNCGENAKNGLEILRNIGLLTKHIILIQDPLMQLRSKASIEKLAKSEKIISYAPFIPQINKDMSYSNDIPYLWKQDRFMELILGEIPRLRDDAEGYGPNGKNFISHVDIPEDINDSYDKIKNKYYKNDTRKII